MALLPDCFEVHYFIRVWDACVLFDFHCISLFLWPMGIEAGSMHTDVASQVLGFSSRFQDTRLEAVGWLCSKVESIRTTQQGNFSIF